MLERSTSLRQVLVFALAAAGCSDTTPALRIEAPISARLSYVLPLDSELVFAYSRISGNGSYLVYSSEPDKGEEVRIDNQVLHVYDLRSGRVIFEDTGVDGYWSPDGTRLIYKAFRDKRRSVHIWDMRSGHISRDVMPVELGDYHSWGTKGTTDVLVTIDGWFLTTGTNQRASKPQRIAPCPEIGRGSRPLVSRDGERVSVFVSDELVLRNLRNCGDIVRTGIVAAKADWSRDRRYVAFHTPKSRKVGYDIGVYDTTTSAFRRLDLTGSGFFPSWTDDNALVFRYSGPDYTGFVRADDVLAAPVSAKPPPSYLRDGSAVVQHWRTILPRVEVVVVLLWASWSAHAEEALNEFVTATAHCRTHECVRIAAYDPSSEPRDVARFTTVIDGRVPIFKAPWDAVLASGGANQSPTYLMFLDGCLRGRWLGTLSATQVGKWIAERRRGEDDSGNGCVPLA